jgi:hypothetical protein
VHNTVGGVKDAARKLDKSVRPVKHQATEKAQMSKQPTEDEPEIAPPTPDTKQQPVKPEIPNDKNTPEKKALVRESCSVSRVSEKTKLKE